MAGVEYIPGGATQNSIRVAQWMLQEAGATAYMGCVGKDANAETMKAKCTEAGVNACYMVDDSTPTGTCACCILGKERSLCTNLHAANNYKETHLQQPANWAIASGAKIIYSAGFFITVSPPSIKLASMEAAKNGNLYCMNLSAPFIVQVPPFKAVLDETIPYVDFFFWKRDRGSDLGRCFRLGLQRHCFHCYSLELDPNQEEQEAHCRDHSRQGPHHCCHQRPGANFRHHPFGSCGNC